MRAMGGQPVSNQVTSVRLQCYLEQSPNWASRVALSQEKDALGMPRVQMNWQMTDLELKTLRFMTRMVTEEFNRLRVAEIKPDDWLISGTDWQQHLSDCAHHMGTTRMGQSPTRAVIDPSCEVFGVQNLYVCGSSAFPTSGYANPTLTIVALAIRLAETLKMRLRSHSPYWVAAHAS